MIGKLKGIIDHTDPDGIIVLDVNGVGYVLHCSMRSMAALPGEGQAAVMLVETQVREDAITLFGFATASEQAWFKLLTTVQGVAARMALAILSTLTPQELSTAIAAQDKAMLSRAKGVGPKLAARIATELKDKAANLAIASAGKPTTKSVVGSAGAVASAAPANDATPVADDDRDARLVADAVSALVNLGYGRSEAFQAVAEASQGQEDAVTVEALVPAALKKLAVGS